MGKISCMNGGSGLKVSDNMKEVKDNKVSVEPYEYYDRNCAISMKSDDFNKLISGKLDPVLAFTVGKLKVDGDVGKALEFSKLLK